MKVTKLKRRRQQRRITWTPRPLNPTEQRLVGEHFSQAMQALLRRRK